MFYSVAYLTNEFPPEPTYLRLLSGHERARADLLVGREMLCLSQVEEEFLSNEFRIHQLSSLESFEAVPHVPHPRPGIRPQPR